MKVLKRILIASVISSFAVTTSFADANLVAKGDKIFNTKTLGNCLACHAANGKDINSPGTLGPKLQYMSAWPTKALYDKVYDPYTTNPTSAMPAFGKNGWLDDGEIKAVVAYLKTIQ